jgi:type IX secretion system PorP/SprF family membrane protein
MAQDFHLSQYDANPLYLNPALTGMRMNEDWVCRANINYREQWKNFLPAPATTVAAGFDMPINQKFSVGQYVIDNKGLNNSFNTFNIMLSGSYKVTHKDVDNPHDISVGLQLGLLQKSYNPGNFVYDSQYSPSSSGSFDQGLPSGENYGKENLFNFDANMGIYYRFADKDKAYSPFGGFSIYHLTNPNESFTGGISKTPMRFTFHGGCDYKVSDEFRMLPQFLYMNQANANELNIGIIGFYKIKDTNYEPMLGIAWRNKDALVFHFGLKQKNSMVRISYDMNNSYLQQYSNGKGGLELSIIYMPKKKSPAASPSIDGATEIKK